MWHSCWPGLNTDILKKFHSFLGIANSFPKELPSVKKNISIQVSKIKFFLFIGKTNAPAQAELQLFLDFEEFKEKQQQQNKNKKNQTKQKDNKK